MCVLSLLRSIRVFVRSPVVLADAQFLPGQKMRIDKDETGEKRGCDSCLSTALQRHDSVGLGLHLAHAGDRSRCSEEGLLRSELCAAPRLKLAGIQRDDDLEIRARGADDSLDVLESICYRNTEQKRMVAPSHSVR